MPKFGPITFSTPRFLKVLLGNDSNSVDTLVDEEIVIQKPELRASVIPVVVKQNETAADIAQEIEAMFESRYGAEVDTAHYDTIARLEPLGGRTLSADERRELRDGNRKEKADIDSDKSQLAAFKQRYELLPQSELDAMTEVRKTFHEKQQQFLDKGIDARAMKEAGKTYAQAPASLFEALEIGGWGDDRAAKKAYDRANKDARRKKLTSDEALPDTKHGADYIATMQRDNTVVASDHQAEGGKQLRFSDTVDVRGFNKKADNVLNQAYLLQTEMPLRGTLESYANDSEYKDSILGAPPAEKRSHKFRKDGKAYFNAVFSENVSLAVGADKDSVVRLLDESSALKKSAFKRGASSYQNYSGIVAEAFAEALEEKDAGAKARHSSQRKVVQGVAEFLDANKGYFKELPEQALKDFLKDAMEPVFKDNKKKDGYYRTRPDRMIRTVTEALEGKLQDLQAQEAKEAWTSEPDRNQEFADKRMKFETWANDLGFTPLHKAAYLGNTRDVTMLLERGEQINIRPYYNDGNKDESKQLVDNLITSGEARQVNARVWKTETRPEGITPLHMAVANVWKDLKSEKPVAAEQREQVVQAFSGVIQALLDHNPKVGIRECCKDLDLKYTDLPVSIRLLDTMNQEKSAGHSL